MMNDRIKKYGNEANNYSPKGRAVGVIQKLAFFYLVSICFGIWGFLVGFYKIPPHNFIVSNIKAVEAYVTSIQENNETLLERASMHIQEQNLVYDFSGFKFHDEHFVESGFLLLSRFRKDVNQVVIELLEIESQQVIKEWMPPVTEIVNRTKNKDLITNYKNGYRSQHPLMLEDGSIVISSGEGPLVRISRDNEIIWIINKHFHHSIELDHKGNIVVPIFNKPQLGQVPPDYRDDGFAIISQKGQILEQYSVGKILYENGYRGLFIGVGDVLFDRLHVNDAQPILEDCGLARQGDIAFSIRHLSTVFLYRPSENKIIWLENGPWLYQHDVNILNSGEFTVFGNDIYYYMNDEQKVQYKANPEGISQVYVYDPQTREIRTPYTEILAKMKVFSATEGRCRILDNGDLYIEETDSRRLIRASKNQLRWEFMNTVTPKTTGALHWCRYLTVEELPNIWRERISGN